MYKINITLVCIFIVFTGCESKKPIIIRKKGVNRNMEDLKSRISQYIETGIKGVYYDPKTDVDDGHINRLFVVGTSILYFKSIDSFPSRDEALKAAQNRAKYQALTELSFFDNVSTTNIEKDSEIRTIRQSESKLKKLILVGSDYKENEFNARITVVYQLDFFSEDDLVPFVSGNILCHRSYFKNQDPGTEKRLSKIWINGVLVIEQKTFIKESDGMELLNVVFLQKWEATGMPYFYLNIKAEENTDGEVKSEKIVSMVWDESGNPISPANGFKVDPSFDLKSIENQ